MPFMPQAQQRQNPMRIVQEIMMMKMQQNQQRKQREEQFKFQEQQSDKAFKLKKLLAEQQWQREEPIRDLATKKFGLEEKKFVETQANNQQTALIKQMTNEAEILKRTNQQKFDAQTQQRNALEDKAVLTKMQTGIKMREAANKAAGIARNTQMYNQREQMDAAAYKVMQARKEKLQEGRSMWLPDAPPKEMMGNQPIMSDYETAALNVYRGVPLGQALSQYLSQPENWHNRQRETQSSLKGIIDTVPQASPQGQAVIPQQTDLNTEDWNRKR